MVFFTLIGHGPRSQLTTFIMIAIIPHKMFSLCKQSLKYNRRIMWNWKTSAPGIIFFLILIAHVHDTTYQIENFIRLILRMSRFPVTMHVFCFNFNTFLKTSSLFFTLHATYRYIQINIKKNIRYNSKAYALLFEEDHLLFNLISTFNEYKY